MSAQRPDSRALDRAETRIRRKTIVTLFYILWQNYLSVPVAAVPSITEPLANSLMIKTNIL